MHDYRFPFKQKTIASHASKHRGESTVSHGAVELPSCLDAAELTIARNLICLVCVCVSFHWYLSLFKGPHKRTFLGVVTSGVVPNSSDNGWWEAKLKT